MSIRDVRSKWPVGIAGTVALAILIWLMTRPMGIEFSTLPARESSAVGRLRNIVREQREFRTVNGCFASGLAQLPDVTSRDHDYAYVVLPQAKDEKGCVTAFIVTATPHSWEAKNGAYFSVDQEETLRYEKTHPADSNSQIIQ